MVDTDTGWTLYDTHVVVCSLFLFGVEGLAYRGVFHALGWNWEHLLRASLLRWSLPVVVLGREAFLNCVLP